MKIHLAVHVYEEGLFDLRGAKFFQAPHPSLQLQLMTHSNLPLFGHIYMYLHSVFTCQPFPGFHIYIPATTRDTLTLYLYIFSLLGGSPAQFHLSVC